ncbi:8-oxoguanine deaminase [Micromonospora sp. ANENR4]|nr:8-oxoguanine deaminase [Micromonospora sp. ANENR4]MBF5033682.1 8-oxoguanine deaminase [Micromonospora sp. ANENR4]
MAIEGCAIATVDASGTEYEYGHVVIEHGRIAAIGPGPSPTRADIARIDGRGCLATPGLVNVHHHLYQWATRGLAQDHDLFGWLTSLYPVWAAIDADLVRDTTAAGLAWLALSGCTTSADHPYIFPDRVGDLLAAEVAEARRIGLRLHVCRGAIDLGRSRGGLPPDELVENSHACLSAMEQAISDFHDPSPGAMVRVAIAPCSPFSVSAQLMSESAALARAMGVRLHTHLAETIQEEHYCRDKFGVTPVRYLERLGWLADDVWLAHGVHLSDDAIETMAKEGVAVAHCPSSNARLGAGIAPVRRMLDAGIAVGLGVDGPASQESGLLVAELRQAMYSARLAGGPTAMSAREALRMGTIGGARCLGRQDEIGSLEVGKLADIALWRLDTLGHAGIADPVAALVFGPPAGLARLVVHGREVVVNGELQTADTTELTRGLEESCRRLAASH